MIIALASGERATTELSRQAAEAQLDIMRIEKFARRFLTRSRPATEVAYDELNKNLARLERYERRAGL
jgi:hypothetical protein